MHDAAPIERTQRKFQDLTVVMDERMRGQWAVAQAMELGWDGISYVSQVTGISRKTILAGVRVFCLSRIWKIAPLGLA